MSSLLSEASTSRAMAEVTRSPGNLINLPTERKDLTELDLKAASRQEGQFGRSVEGADQKLLKILKDRIDR